MVFSSAVFIFFFLPLFLFLNSSIKKQFQLTLLIFSSLLFYIWGEGYGVFILLSLALANYLIAIIIRNGKSELPLSSSTNAKSKPVVRNLERLKFFSNPKFWLFVGVTLNLAFLFYYKYLTWLLYELEKLFPLKSLLPLANSIPSSIALPLGISFFCFHGISYLVDTYKGIIGNHSTEDFFAYFFMFPHLVAGPIVRFESIRKDLQNRSVDFSLFIKGLLRFIVGVNKKVLIANSVAPIADIAFFSSSASISTADAWIGALAYSLQIYFDFSGYSDMAIGLAAMMGIKFDENFMSPYKSHSIKEFWRRWHISLSSWLRDYLFIPLGGSRCSSLINYRNLLIVFICCGFWHGAEFTFVLWGIYHGFLLIIEKTKFGTYLQSIPTFLSRIYCLLAVTIGWVLFRALDLTHAMNYLHSMFNFLNPVTSSLNLGVINILAMFIGALIAIFGLNYVELMKSSQKTKTVFGLFNLLFFILSLTILYTDNRNPFIYFNF